LGKLRQYLNGQTPYPKERVLKIEQIKEIYKDGQNDGD
jgi:hypothetical protein